MAPDNTPWLTRAAQDALRRRRKSSMAPDDTPWLTRAQAAAYLQVAVVTLENWAVRGGGPPYVKPRGGLVRYHKDALDNWLTAHTRLHSADDGRASAILAKTQGL